MFDFKFPKYIYPGQLICPLYRIDNTENKVIYNFLPGPGTMIQKYNVNNQEIEIISATLAGIIECKEKDDQKIQSVSNSLSLNEQDAEMGAETEKHQSKSIKYIVSVFKVKNKSEEILKPLNYHIDNDFSNHLPKEGDIVLTRVTRITQKRANVEILVVETNIIPVDCGIGSKGTSLQAIGGSSTSYSVSQSSDIGDTFGGIIRSQDVRATDRDRVKIADCFRLGDIVRAQVISLGDGLRYYLTTAKNDLGVVFARASRGAGGLMYAADWQTMIAPSTGATEQRKCANPFK